MIPVEWQWLLSSTFRFWVLVVVIIALAVAIRLNWSRLPQRGRWAGVIFVGVLGVWLVVSGLVNVVSDLCSAPRRDAISMLLILAGTLTLFGGAYLRAVTQHVKQLRRVTEALKRRIAADHPHDDVIVADDGAVTFRPRPR
ncbi:MAG: hypothetical protein AUH31_09830 [Armatimonadetes bacterium 13_1_40CM_64_14]|nr:MAG: hypothetical protein AUH31_09830 [Armatimonadetes bacterium 13_1_40CM_64_14]